MKARKYRYVLFLSEDGLWVTYTTAAKLGKMIAEYGYTPETLYYVPKNSFEEVVLPFSEQALLKLLKSDILPRINCEGGVHMEVHRLFEY
jgi:hypothetical protein